MECSYRLFYPVRPWTINKERTMHYHTRAKLVKEWREAFCELAKEAKIPPLNHFNVDVQPIVKNRRSLPDVCAAAGSVKAAIDGIVDFGVVPDDRPEFVKWVRFYAPAVGPEEGLQITVIGEPKGDSK